jgi:hypothetical protein
MSKAQNADFEQLSAGMITSSTQISGWVISSAEHSVNLSSNTCNMLACCPNQPFDAQIINAPFGLIDPVIGNQYPIYSVFGSPNSPSQSANAANPHLAIPMFGARFLKLNSVNPGQTIHRAVKTITVMPGLSLFQYAVISVNQGGHSCCDGGAVNVTIKNITTSSLIACGSTKYAFPYTGPGTCSVVNPPTAFLCGSATQFTVNNGVPNGSNVYHRWDVQSIDLSPYAGQVISVEFVASDCVAGGHHSYAYIDCSYWPVTVLVNGNPVSIPSGTANVVSCTNPATICLPYGGNFVAYEWSGPAGTYTSTSPCYQTSLSGVYNATCFAASSCGTASPIQITFSLSFNTPALNIASSSSSLCLGQTATLTAQGATSYSWSTGSNAGSLAVSPTVTTTYTLLGTDAAGCTYSGNITLVVNSSPTITISSSHPTLCAGSQGTLNALGAGSYTWSGGSVLSVAIITPTANTTYTVIGAMGACTASATHSQAVSPPVAVWINCSDTTLCAGDTAILTASGVPGFTWSTGASQSSISVNPVTSSIYTVTGMNSVGCTGTTSVQIQVAPPMQMLVSDTIVCPGNASTLTVIGAATCTWNTLSNALNLVVSPTVTTAYSVSAVHAFGCVFSGNTTITAVPPESISSSTNQLCHGSTATLVSSGVNTCTWSTGATGTMVTVTPSATTTYSLISVTPSGCTLTANYTQTVTSCLTSSFVVFPNPAGSSVTVQTSSSFTLGQFMIYNSLNQLVLSVGISNGYNLVSLTLNSGVYSYVILQSNSPVASGLLAVQ